MKECYWDSIFSLSLFSVCVIEKALPAVGHPPARCVFTLPRHFPSCCRGSDSVVVPFPTRTLVNQPRTGCCSVAQSCPTLVSPRTAARQACLSTTSSWSLLKRTSIESVMPSSHPVLCRPFSSCLQPFPASGSFPGSQLFTSSGQRIGVSASVLPIFRTSLL